MSNRALYGFSQQARKSQIAIAKCHSTLGTVGRGLQNTHTGTWSCGYCVPRLPTKAVAAGNTERTHDRTCPMADEAANQDPWWQWARRPSRRRIERQCPHNMRPRSHPQTQRHRLEHLPHPPTNSNSNQSMGRRVRNDRKTHQARKPRRG